MHNVEGDCALFAPAIVQSCPCASGPRFPVGRRTLVHRYLLACAGKRVQTGVLLLCREDLIGRAASADARD
jgi:hypothetical protein